MSMKKRYLQKKLTVENATNEELFTELMKRVLVVDSRVCYFVDKEYSTKQWRIYGANSSTIVSTEGMK